MPWSEVFDHADELRRHDRDERQWHLSSLWSVLAGRVPRRQLRDSIKQIDVRSWRDTSASVYDEYDDETRLLLIGAALNAQVEREGKIVILEGKARDEFVSGWIESHPHETEWLADQSVTPEMARQHHADWLAKREAWLQQARHVGITPQG